ncbi:hypothetical protein G6F57_011295 [Rhizopus arrhizus]|nr:hypothetical protein G6F57_011295 [Rhizopus arrhizus]
MHRSIRRQASGHIAFNESQVQRGQAFDDFPRVAVGQIAGGGGAGAQAQRAGFQPAPRFAHGLRLAIHLAQLPGLLGQAFAGFRQRDAVAAAAVQRFAEPFLQHAQLAGDGGLGQMQHLGGAADVAGIGYTSEDMPKGPVMSTSSSTTVPLPAAAGATAAAPAAAPTTTPWRDKLNGVLFVGLMAGAVMQLADLPAIRQLGFSPLVVGLVCGMLYGTFLRGTMPADWGVGVNFTARRLLRSAAAFYGSNLSLQQIAAVGLPGLAVSVAVVLGTLLIGTVVGQRMLGLDRATAMLTAAGRAICGAAAVLAVAPPLRAAPHKSAVAVATVVLFGTLSMFLYPILYHAGWLDFDTQALGIYIGGTIHEVAQVVGAASNIDPATTEVATIVKMTRVALLVPVLLVLGMYLRSAASQAGGQANRIGEGQPEHGARHRRDAGGQQRRGAGAIGQVQCGQAEAVGALGVEREQEGAGKRIHASVQSSVPRKARV